MIIPQVTALFEVICGRGLVQVTGVVEYPDCNGGDVVRLARYPVTTLTSVFVSLDQPRSYAGGNVLVVGTDVILMAENLVARVDGGTFPRGPRTTQVTYTGGYSTIPGDLEAAAVATVQVMLMKGKAKQYHVSGVDLGDGSISNIVQEDIPPAAMQVLKKYAHLVLA